jgi:hypothetical protein
VLSRLSGHASAGLAAALLALAASVLAQDVELAFDDLPLPDNTRIHFKMRSNGPVPVESINLARAPWARVGRYWLYVDSTQTRLDSFPGYPALRYAAYVKTEADSRHLAAWEVLGEPLGVFEDQIAEVSFELREAGPGSTAMKGTIRLPVGSSQPPRDTLVLDKPLLQIPLSGGPASVMIKARRPGVTLLLRQKRVSAVDPVWNAPPHWGASSELVVSEEHSLVIPLETYPSLASAIESVLKSSANEPAGKLLAQFDFSTQLFEDRPRSQEIEIPFRFVPSLLHVALALVIGAALGAGIPVLRAWPGIRGAARCAVVGILAALVSGFVGGLLVTHNSRFMILGFDLNPLELLPATVLGICCGLATEKVLTAAGLLK